MTFFQALALVLIVVFIFLGSLRTTLVPLLAIPVSLIGTFAFFGPLGFSINMLTLFGLILAIGTVVDDAIVVVESVEFHLSQGLSPTEATERTMKEVSSVLVASSLVMCAVFVPVAFMPGITGELYRQFALTISVSIMLSTVVALSLTPAMCRILLRQGKPMRGPVGWFLRLFNRGRREDDHGLHRGHAHPRAHRRVRPPDPRRCSAWLLEAVRHPADRVRAGRGPGLPLLRVDRCPTARRWSARMRSPQRAEEDLGAIPGVRSILTLGGLNLLTGAYTSNNTSLILMLDDWGERLTPELQLESHHRAGASRRGRVSRGPRDRVRAAADSRAGYCRWLPVRAPGPHRDAHDGGAGTSRSGPRGRQPRATGAGRPLQRLPRERPAGLLRARPRQGQDARHPDRLGLPGPSDLPGRAFR